MSSFLSLSLSFLLSLSFSLISFYLLTETNTPVSSATASVASSAAPPTNDQANSFNILANNIRTTQNLLSALAKNLPSTTNNQMRAIAARVLASPVRPQGSVYVD